LFEDSKSLPALAQQALSTCHVNPATGEEEAEWDARCSAARYDCLLSYYAGADRPRSSIGSRLSR
jgi:hypothetical protein